MSTWHGFLETDLVSNMILDLERTPLAGSTHPVLFAGEQELTIGKYATRNPGHMTLMTRPFSDSSLSALRVVCSVYSSANLPDLPFHGFRSIFLSVEETGYTKPRKS